MSELDQIHVGPGNGKLVESLSGRLAEAEASREPIAPLTDLHPNLSPEQAYAIQRRTIAARTAGGSHLRGHKVGLTAKVMQQQFGIDEPDFGHLLDDMFVFEASQLSLSRFIAPRVEVEPAFVLERRLEGPGVTVADVIRATAFVLPSLEIIDSRVRDWRIQLADTIADNGSSAAVVLGGRPTALTAFDPRDLDVEMLVDDRIVERGSTSAILGNPLTSIAWLANKLGPQGVALEEGHVVLPGTCTHAVRIQTPATVVGRIAVLGDVAIEFVD